MGCVLSVNGTGTQQKRRLSKKRRRRRRSVAILLLMSLLLGAVFAIIHFFFSVTDIKVENSISSTYTVNEISAASGIIIGQNIFSFKTAEIESVLLRDLTYLGTVTVQRKLPNTVVINVSETTDYAAVPYRGGYLIVSRELRILSDVHQISDNIPTVYGTIPGNFNPGTRFVALEEHTADSLELILNQLYIYDWFDAISVINVRDKLNLSLIYEDRMFIQLGTSSGIDYKFEMLYEVVTNQLEGDYKGEIDLSTAGKAICSEGEMSIPYGYFDVGAGE